MNKKAEEPTTNDVDEYFEKLTQGQPKEKAKELNKVASGPAKDTIKTILFGKS